MTHFKLLFRWRENELYIDYVEQTAGNFLLLCIYAFIHTVIGREKFQWDIGFTNVMNCHYSDYTKYDSKFKMVWKYHPLKWN